MDRGILTRPAHPLQSGWACAAWYTAAMAARPYHQGPDLYRFGEGLFRRIGRLKKDFFSTNELLEDEQGQIWVLKISRFLYIDPFGRSVARYLSLREQYFYRLLQGVEGIPAIYPTSGRNWLLHAFIPGDTLQVRRDVDDQFFDRLATLLAGCHERGVACVDISKKANIIVGDDGKPYLIDFQISMGLLPPQSPMQRIWNQSTRHQMQEDLYHIYKHKKRIRGDLLRDWEHTLAVTRPGLNRFHGRFIRRPYLSVKRLIFPQGSHELFFFRKRENLYPGG